MINEESSKPMHQNKRTRVVFFSFGILEQGGGFENYVISTTKDLTDIYQDLEISVVTMSPRIVERLQYALTLYYFQKKHKNDIYREDSRSVKKRLGKVKYLQANSLRELKGLLKKNNLIYSKNEVLELATLKLLGLHRLPPIIVGLHTPIHYPLTPSLNAKLHNIIYSGIIYKTLIRGVRSVHVFNSDDLSLVKTKLHLSDARLIMQAFDLPETNGANAENDVLRLLFVGRLTEQKGTDILISIAERLVKDRTVRFRLRVAGSGDDKIANQIKELAKTYEEIEYLGHVNNEHIYKLYEWTDVTVIPSKYETLNKVAAETAAASRISICSDIPGPREIIKDKITGYLVPPSPDEFIKVISKLAKLKRNDQTAFRQIGKSANEYIREKFSPENVYNDMYKDILRVTTRH